MLTGRAAACTADVRIWADPLRAGPRHVHESLLPREDRIRFRLLEDDLGIAWVRTISKGWTMQRQLPYIVGGPPVPAISLEVFSFVGRLELNIEPAGWMVSTPIPEPEQRHGVENLDEISDVLAWFLEMAENFADSPMNRYA